MENLPICRTGLNISDVAPVIQTPEPSSTVGLVEGPISEEIDENTDLVAQEMK